MASPEHHPQGDPCDRDGCGLPAARHRLRQRARPDKRQRPRHVPDATRICSCGVHAVDHRPPLEAQRRGPRPASRQQPRKRGARGERKRKPAPTAANRVIIGLDGEGVGRGPHRYIYLAASDDEGGRQCEVRAAPGRSLTTVQCLDLILSLPESALVFGYGTGYDVTKILGDLPPSELYALFHPETRRNEDGHAVPVRWKKYRINYQNRTLTVRRGNRRRSVHDVIKFFQCRFVQALEEWKVATEAELREMELMKKKRPTFDERERARIESYCRDECRRLAQLVRRLLVAHEEAGIALSRFDGPGSSATVLMKRMDVLSHRGELPAELDLPVRGAFFGGRFEHARVGPVRGRVWDYDLASAYPYAATALPCLAHGRWRHVQAPSAREIDRATLALVRWTGGAPASSRQTWGALPVRTEDGCIIFPLAAAGGWVWRREFAAAQAFGAYAALEAWLFEGCDCPPPFAELADVYRERVKLGKNGPGRVLKLASNSVPGKTMQSVGKAPFRSLVWGGLITSDTRAELLELTSQEPEAVISHATDGLKALCRLKMRAPRDTGTSDLDPPLGAWEESEPENAAGVFLVRPGIYFPLGIKKPKLRARGIARDALQRALRRIIKAHADGRPSVVIGGMQRFCGAKSSLHLRRYPDAEPVDPACGWTTQQGVHYFLGTLHEHGADGVARAVTAERAETFGEWVPHEVDLHFNPHPKRVREVRGRLLPWKYVEQESRPYHHDDESPDAAALAALDAVNAEQPDGEVEG